MGNIRTLGSKKRIIAPSFHVLGVTLTAPTIIALISYETNPKSAHPATLRALRRFKLIKKSGLSHRGRFYRKVILDCELDKDAEAALLTWKGLKKEE